MHKGFIFSNINSLLSRPSFFRFFKYLVVGKCYSILAKEYVYAKNEDKILDIGCGIGDILEYLPEVEYIGFDMEHRYINAAIKHYGKRGKFLCRKVSKEAIKENSYFDIVLANCVLHHLNDNEATELFALAQYALKPNGRLVSMDPCYIKKQSPVVRYIFSKDRGQFIRTEKEYLALASKVFTNIKSNVCNSLLRIPYTHIIMECKK